MGISDKDDTFMGQFRCPTGVQGRAVAALMNQDHDALSNWGLSHIQIKPDFVVLDVGCGGGRTIGKLARQASRGLVLGIDYSKDMVKYSKEQNLQLVKEGRIGLTQASVEKLCFPNDFFDLVTAIETYYFWSNVQTAFQEIRRALKPNGKLLIVSEMVKDGKYEVENAETVKKCGVRLLSLQEIENLLASAKFAEVKVFKKPDSVWNTVVGTKA
ncbi:MAG: class I SAM-dependent methyltransferase [Candidatus Bathyarchaeota archaeon]|nr:class I SAM-dependent methyltransferase [Candidatus Bathyarchaeota archaeon]